MNDVDEIMARVQTGGKVTHEEAEFVVRNVQRRCKGPIKPEYVDQYAEFRAGAGSFGGQEKGYDLAAFDAVARLGCGADFNDLLCTFPFDGTEHSEPCQNCGTVISFRSPFFLVSG